MSSRVLLVIDLLNDFLDPRGALYCGDEARKIVPVIRSLIDGFTRAGDRVIYLRDAHAPMDKEFELFPPHAVKGTWGSDIIAELKPDEKALVVDKTRFSGFFGNNLSELLAEIGPAEVWVSGVLTSICVMDTAGDLRNRDYSVVVPVDAVADIESSFTRVCTGQNEKGLRGRLDGCRSRRGTLEGHTAQRECR